MTPEQERTNEVARFIVLILVLFMDTLGIWLGWNLFIAHVSGLPEVSFTAACGCMLMKNSFLRHIK